MPAGGDASNLFWPIKTLVEQSLWHDGVIPLWNPWSYMGVPLHASLQHAVFYPADRIIYTFIPEHAGVHWGALLHLIFCGLGVYFFIRWALNLSTAPAIICGAAFPCSAWFWGHTEHNNILAVSSYLPWMAATVWLAVNRRITPRNFLLIYSMLSALQFLAGHPQEAYYSQFFCFLLYIFFLFKGRRFARKLFLFWAAAGLVGACIIAVQLVPALELAPLSRRAVAEPAESLYASMPPQFLLTMIDPGWFGNFREGYTIEAAHTEFRPFIGLPLLLLAIAAPFFQRRRLTYFLAGAAVFTALLSLGGNTDPSRLLSGEFTQTPDPGWSFFELISFAIPGMDNFRVPARWLLITAFCLTILSALCLDFFLSMAGKKAIPISLFTFVLVFFSVYIPARNDKFHYPSDLQPLLSTWQNEDFQKRTIDNRLYRLTLSDDSRLAAERTLETSEVKGIGLLQRYLVWHPHHNILRKRAILDGYEEGLLPTLRYHDFLWEFNRNLRSGRPDKNLLKLMGVSTIYTDLAIDQSAFPLDRQLAIAPGGIYTTEVFAPAAFTPANASSINFQRLDGPWYRSGTARESFNRESVSFISEEEIEWVSTGVTDIINNNTIRIESQSPNPPAYLAMGHFPGWVSESGDPIQWANAIHAELPHFEDSITLQFKPFSYRLGLYLSAIGLTVWFFLFSCREKFSL